MALAEYGNALNIDTDASGNPILIDPDSGDTIAIYDRGSESWEVTEIQATTGDFDSVNAGELNIDGADVMSAGNFFPLETISDSLSISKTNTTFERVNDGSFVEPRVFGLEGLDAVRFVSRFGNTESTETTFARIAFQGDVVSGSELSVTGSKQTVDSGWVSSDETYNDPVRIDLETRVSGGTSDFTWEVVGFGLSL